MIDVRYDDVDDHNDNHNNDKNDEYCTIKIMMIYNPRTAFIWQKLID